jgi:hypothetical protein
MTWINDLFTAGTLGAQWTAVTPDGSINYPAAGNSSVELFSNTGANSIWVTAANATRLEQGIADNASFEIYTALLDNPIEAGLFVRGATITSDFAKFGIFAGGFTFAWAAGGVANFNNGGASGAFPVALRLVRSGSSWSAYYASAVSADDPGAVSWTQFHTTVTAAFTVAAGGLYAGGADSPRFDYGVSTLAAPVTGTGSAVLGALSASAAGVRTIVGAAVASPSGLAATASGVRTVTAASMATLGASTATAAGTRTVRSTAAASFAALVATMTAPATIPGTATAVLGALTATAAGSSPQAETGGSWYGLLDIAREYEQLLADELARSPEACPNDGEPLQAGPGGVLHCRFDGWRSDDQ